MDPEREIAALFERHAARNKLPGWAIRVDILSLDRSLRVFNGNARELNRHLEEPSEPGEILRLWDPNPEAFEQFLDEVDRLLHNYLAASTSLKDHSVRVRDRRLLPSADDDFAAGYEARAEAMFAKSRLARFVRLLRNYSLHRRLPVARGRLQSGVNLSFESHVVLPTQDLLRWDGWTGLAKQFIEEAGDEIVLQEVISSHTATVRRFQKWFRQALVWRHRDAIRELEAEEEAIADAFSAQTGEPIRKRKTPDPTQDLT